MKEHNGEEEHGAGETHSRGGGREAGRQAKFPVC